MTRQSWCLTCKLGPFTDQELMDHLKTSHADQWQGDERFEHGLWNVELKFLLNEPASHDTV